MKSNRSPMESLEARQLMAATIRGTDVRTLTASDKTKDNGNDVVVRFSGPIKSVDATKFRMFGYSNNTLQGGQTKTTINVKSVTIDPTNANNVIVRTDVMVRKGAQLTLQAGAVTDQTDAGVTGSVRTTKGLNRDRFTLALRQFTVGDKSMFSSAYVAGGATVVPANTEPSASSVLTNLTAFLNKKVKAKTITQAKMDSALATFNSNLSKSIAPSANIRAAIVSLVGTVGEPAINVFLGTANTTGKVPITIAFDGSQISSGAKMAELSYTQSSGRLKLIFNPNYAGESFAALSGRFAHEAIHEGGPQSSTNFSGLNSQDEEVIANFVEFTVYAQQIVNDFTVATPNTDYVTYANYRTYLLLNSGDRQFPRVGVKNAPLKNPGGAAPGFDTTYNSTAVVSFEQDVRNEMDDRNIDDKDPTPSTSVARQILTNITGDTYTSSTTFGDALIDGIDIGQDTLGDAFVMRVARVLQVTV